MHASRRDAFRPVNELPLAKVYENGNIDILNNNYKKRNNDKVVVDDKFEHKTALLYVYPGMNPEILDYYRKEKYKGIVLAATGLGNVSTMSPKYSLVKKIKELTDNGIAVVIAPQTIYGRVHPYVYSPLRKLSIELNCIFAEDMLPETAYIKLGWVLPQAHNIEEIKEMMLTNYAGEISERTDEKAFLY
ncbi:hypothetical protein HYX04_02320 [Candidatus Woesearchaeota archaeon]|nr:hypothetical protein [Candidatus Woesearchaeota archaeon]